MEFFRAAAASMAATGRRNAGLFLAAACVAALIACSPNRPKLSGFGLGTSRIVGEGDVLQLRLPLHPRGGRSWRVTKYDSAFIDLVEPPEVVGRGGEGAGEMVIRARARRPGQTTIEVTETLTAEEQARGEVPQVVEFNVRIVE